MKNNSITLTKLVCCLTSLFFSSSPSFSQTKDDNVVITYREEVYTFEASNGNLVIRETTNSNYSCLQMRERVQVAEFYNDYISIDNFRVKGLFSPKPQYQQYTPNGVFYSDSKVCFVTLGFDNKHKSAQISFNKTYKDPRYLTTIFLPHVFYTQQKKMVFHIPSWVDVELMEYNFGENITRTESIDPATHMRTYTYTILNQESLKSEPNMPGYGYIYPHILFQVKSATINGQKTTYFETIKDFYRWGLDLTKDLKNDDEAIRAKAHEIVKDCTTDMQKIQNIFSWVQNNIRYIAFEHGISAFRPDAPSEVLHKRYGDCKGMTALLRALLKAEGFDARYAWIGTNELPYDFKTPSIALFNHMICALFHQSDIYYLDATVGYVPIGTITHNTEGRPILIESKDENPVIRQIPEATPHMNTDSLYCEYTLTGNQLSVRAERFLKGEAKQFILSALHSVPKDKSEEALQSYLSRGKQEDKISDLQLLHSTSQDTCTVVSYTMTKKSGVQQLGNEYYIEIEPWNDIFTTAIDTTKRVHDVEQGYKYHNISRVALHIPEGYTHTHIPDNFSVRKDDYMFSISYQATENKIIYQREITVFKNRLKRSDIDDWNADVRKLIRAYSEQIILTQTAKTP